MRSVLMSSLTISLLTSPIAAAPINPSDDQVRFGAFAGARLTIPIGGDASKRRTSAGLTIAPTQTRLSSTGFARTRIGDGLALEFARDRPQVMLGGRRADVALGFRPTTYRTGDDPKLGLSTGAVIGIGALLAVGIAAAIYLSQDCNRLNENECSE